MGQRSQIIIRYENTDYQGNFTHYTRIARHLQWNWGKHMIQRASQVVQQMQAQERSGVDMTYHTECQLAGILSTFCVNRITGLSMGLHEDEDMADWNASEFDNNNGLFLLNIPANGEWTFGLVIGTEDAGDCYAVSTAAEYLAADGYDANAVMHACPEELATVATALAVLSKAEQEGHHMPQDIANQLYKKEQPMKKAR